MKATLEFELPEDITYLKEALSAGPCKWALQDTTRMINRRMEMDISDEIYKELERVQDEITEILNRYTVSLWEE